MAYLKNRGYKIILAIALIATCIICSSTTVNLCVAAKDDVTLSASLQGNFIIVEATGSGNPIMDTQIWGDYGRGWFLIKDYNEGNKSFSWNLTTLHKENESYFLNGNNYKFVDTDMFKIYVRNSTNKDNVKELYKTFYLGSSKQDIQLIAEGYEETDFGTVHQDFPIVVEQNVEVELQLNVGDNSKKYFVKIIGDNYTKDLYNNDGKNLNWTPEESGTFYIAVYDDQNQMLLKRKVYVNSENNEYLQLGNLDIGSNAEKGVYVRLTVKETRPTGYSEDINKSLKFTISESSVWSRTIKDYGDYVSEMAGAYEISEKYDGFELSSGIYNITSYIKTPHSIEYDDVIRKVYQKSGVEGLEFEVTKVCKSENGQIVTPDKDGKYPLQPSGKTLSFTFTVVAPDNTGKYEYAFFLNDARGKRMVKKYATNNNISDNIEFKWTPAEPGQYTVYARIRETFDGERNINPLPNSYEKEIAFPIHIEQTNLDVYLTGVKIEENEWTVTDGGAVADTSNTALTSHKLNIIEVRAEKKQGNEPKHNKNRLMYKVYAVNKGYMYSLGNYSFSNVIPFYPKSTGQYRLIIMVKDVESGSEEDKCEILVDVVDK